MHNSKKAIQTITEFFLRRRIGMSHQNKPKPDDRSNNVERLQTMVQNTIKNIREAEASMEFAGPEEREQIKEKNERRKKAIEGFREEIKDEAAARKRGEV